MLPTDPGQPDPHSATESSKSLLELDDELKRLRSKLNASSDRDIQQALQLRVEALEEQQTKLRQAAASQTAEQNAFTDAEEELGEPTPEQLRKAEELIRQARVEKIRKNNARASELMREAAAVAPSAPAVLEALGDELSERKKWKDALDAYTRALRYSKGNIELEKKHAITALRSKGLSTFDPSLKAAGEDPMFLTAQDTLASNTGAVLLNVLFPGLGHLVVGKTAAGISLILAMIVWVVWLCIMQRDLAELVQMFKNHNSHPNLLVLVPMLGMVVTYIIGFTTLGNQLKRNPNRSISHPRPPMDLPFE
jgi:tetratricopeptide (TPR) repeat protein